MSSYTVRAQARLALCLLDMNGDRGRVDGTLGISLEEPFVEVIASAADSLELDIVPELTDAVYAGLTIAARVAGRPVNVSIQLPNWISPHVGLGHKTQTVLAVAIASLSASSIAHTRDEVIRLSGRGGTSGAGIHSFVGGGVVLDGGHQFGPNGKTTFAPSSAATHIPPPPLIARVPPARIVACRCSDRKGTQRRIWRS